MLRGELAQMRTTFFCVATLRAFNTPLTVAIHCFVVLNSVNLHAVCLCLPSAALCDAVISGATLVSMVLIPVLLLPNPLCGTPVFLQSAVILLILTATASTANLLQ